MTGSPQHLAGRDGRWADAEPELHVLALPAGTPVLSANARLNKYEKARHTRTLRGASAVLARHQRIPHLAMATFTVEYLPPARRHPLASAMIRDCCQLAPTGKALLDGLVDAGVLADDNASIVIQVAYRVSGSRSRLGQLNILLQGVR